MLGRLLDGRYRIIQILGSGGFSKTYIAEDTKLYNTQCVVKQLKPQVNEPTTLQLARRLFDSEAQLLHELGYHDQIPQLLAHFEENEEFYLVQQLIVGHPLNRELTPGQKWSEDYVINLLINILQPLAFVHEHHVIHRDLKPSNLIRRHSDGKIVLIDFGAVKHISTQIASFPDRTKMTVSIGTPGYMPSEQNRGNPKFSSDIYAVGIIGIQALTGLMPDQLPEEDHAQMRWRHLVDISPKLADILDRMVRYDFRQRYQSATQVLHIVQELTNSHTAQPPLITITYPPINQLSHRQRTLYSPSRPALPQYCQETALPNEVLPSEISTVIAPYIKVGWGFYLQWVFMTFFGYVGGLLIGFNFLAVAGDLAVVCFWGLAIGVKQWIILRRKVFRPSWLWIFTTTLSVIIPFFLVGGLNNFQNFAILHGLSVGIAQWLVLRRLVYKAGWWILVNAVGGWVGGIISGAVLVWLLRNPKISNKA
ncbi:protein kinase [Nostoc sp. NIES-2111]